MDIKDSYLHGTVGVVKSISVSADKLTYNLADIAGTVKEITLPVATTSANGLMSSADKNKLDAFNSGSLKNNLILKILADWNPLDVPKAIANEEYVSYVQVLARKTSHEEIYQWLLDFVKDNYGIADVDKKAKVELESIADSLFAVVMK